MYLNSCNNSHSFLHTQNSFAEDKSPMNSATFNGLKFRSIGPALASGRIGDLAVNPENPSTFYVAVASGGVFGVLIMPVQPLSRYLMVKALILSVALQ